MARRPTQTEVSPAQPAELDRGLERMVGNIRVVGKEIDGLRCYSCVALGKLLCLSVSIFLSEKVG